MPEPFSVERVKGPFSESKTKDIFRDAGLDWENRSERYEGLKGTIFEQVTNGKWWIAFDENGYPISSQGIAPFEGVYLLLGLKSFAGEYEEGHKGYGSGLAEYVSDMHSDKPRLGNAQKSGGRGIFINKLGYKKLKVVDGFLKDQDDIPTEVKSALEVAHSREGTPIRKLYWLDTTKWFYTLKR